MEKHREIYSIGNLGLPEKIPPSYADIGTEAFFEMLIGKIPAFQRQAELNVTDVSAVVSNTGFTIDGKGARFAYRHQRDPFWYYTMCMGIQKSYEEIPRFEIKEHRYDLDETYNLGREFPKLKTPISLAGLEAVAGNSNLTIVGEPDVKMTTIYFPPTFVSQGSIRVVSAQAAGQEPDFLLGYLQSKQVSMDLARKAAQRALTNLNMDAVYREFERACRDAVRKKHEDEARKKVSSGDKTLTKYLGL